MNQRGRRTLTRINELPGDYWRTCPGCRTLLHRDRLRRGDSVCPDCGHHFPLSAHDRIRHLVDPDSFEETEADLAGGDPLDFVDRLPYPDRLRGARKATGLTEAVVTGTARLGGHPVVLAVLDFAFLGGSMGSVVGEKVARAAELALARRIPLVVVSSSGGARMQEGIHSLLQMAKTAAAVGRLRAGGVPFVSVLADPVYGGVAASFAALGDVILAETGTRAGFAGPRVIEQTIRQQLPDGFQSAPTLLAQGHIDGVVARRDLPGAVREVVDFFAAARAPRVAALADTQAPAAPTDPARGFREPSGDAWDRVRAARTPGRPTTLEYVERVFGRFLPLHGDRAGGEDEAVVGGFALLSGVPVVVVGHCKGRDTAENVRRNFGMPHPAGYRKAMRLYALAERFGVPVVTLVDTPGAYPGVRAEAENQSGAIAETLVRSAGLRVPIVTVVIGEGGSGGALALAVGDRLLMQENTVYSVISPEGCATILFGDAGRAGDAARALRLDAAELHGIGVADELIPEPDGGAHADPRWAADAISAALRRTLTELAARPVDDLVAARYRRIRAWGAALLPGQDAAPQPRGGPGPDPRRTAQPAVVRV